MFEGFLHLFTLSQVHNEAGSLCSSDSVEEEYEIEE